MDCGNLFDALTCADLTNLYGEAFEKRYKEYEADESIPKETIKAKDLWKRILTNYFEVGSPFLCFKDNANRANPNYHSGIIRSSNLCTEIFQNTEPNKCFIRVEFEDGTIQDYEEYQEVLTDCGIIKSSNKITSTDSINGKKSVYLPKRISGWKNSGLQPSLH